MKNYEKALIMLSVVMMACKKDHVCSCTITTNGTTATHTQTAGFPPLLAASDTTTYQPLYTVNTSKTTYTKVSKSSMRQSCYKTSQESVNQSSTSSSPGIYTITTTTTGTKNYNCEID